MEKAKKTTLTAVYCAGALAVLALLILAAAGPKCVLFPDAMLPMDLRELALAWLAIGFLPMLMASTHFYKVARKKAVFLPAVMCLLSLLFWVGTWTVGMLRSPASASGGDIVLPRAEEIGAVRFTGDEMELTMGGDAFIDQLLQRLSQAEDTGRASVQDVPDHGEGLIQIDLYFKRTAGKGQGMHSSTLFLYREDGGLFLEQPFHKIFRVDDSLEDWLWEQITPELEGLENHV